MNKLLLGIVVFVVCSPCFAQVRRPNTNVQRAEAPTPEVHSIRPERLPNGKATDVVVTGKFFPANAKIDVSGQCKLLKGAMTGANEAHVTLISNSDEGGSCSVNITGSGREASAYLEVDPTAAIKAQRDKEEKEAEAQEAEHRKEEAAKAQESMAYMQKAPEMVGKKWSVTLPNGKSDTWTFVGESFGGGEFKSSTGEKVTVMIQPGEKVMVILGSGCVFQGTMKGSKVDGTAEMPASVCKLGAGKWSANVSK